jgi:hypothetical protein
MSRIVCHFSCGAASATVYLDELAPDRGRDVKEPSIQCGPFCELVEVVYGERNA